jgi:hypothetical protein
MSKFPHVTPWGVKIDRRRFLYATGGFAALAAATPFTSLAIGPAPAFVKNPFTLGVASGDPAPDGMVLWTRLAPEPLAADGRGGVDPVRVPVKWAVALDDQMRNVVRDGTTTATPQFGHSVHVEVSGLAGPVVLVSVHRRRVVEHDRPHAHHGAVERVGQPPPLCRGVVPALRAGVLQRLRAHGE